MDFVNVRMKRSLSKLVWWWIVRIFLVLKPVHEIMSVKSGGIVSFERVDDVKFSILRCGIMLLINVVKVVNNHITRGRVCDTKDLLSVWDVLKVLTSV